MPTPPNIANSGPSVPRARTRRSDAVEVELVLAREGRVAQRLERVLLDHRRAGQVLLHRRRHAPDLVLEVAAGAVHRAREGAPAQDQRRVGESANSVSRGLMRSIGVSVVM